MRYMVMVKMCEDVGAPPQELVEVMGRRMGELLQAGTIVDAGGLAPTAGSVEFRVAGGQVQLTDGPFAEAKEVVGGYSILEVASHDEVIMLARELAEIHQKNWPGWEGSIEVREIAS